MTVETAQRLLTVEDFYRMCDARIFREEERLELVEGVIITMTPIGARHHACVIGVDRFFNRRVGDRALVSVQGPLALGPATARYPDVALLRPRADRYAKNGPAAGDAFLVIEVSDTSLEYDRTVKLPLYAAVGIPEVWIAGLTTDHLEVYRAPRDGVYRSVRRLPIGESIAPEAFPDLVIDVAEILG